MILFNPTKEKVEFRYGGVLVVFKPKESKNLSDAVADHALNRSKVPLVEQTPMYDSQVEYTDVSYANMPWKNLIQLASKRKLFVPGTSRIELERLLNEYDLKLRGTLPQSSN